MDRVQSMGQSDMTFTSSANTSSLDKIRQQLSRRYVVVISYILSHNSCERLQRYLQCTCRSQIQQSSSCEFYAGSYGGGGGNAFDEIPNNCDATIKKIYIRAGDAIDSIQITYRLSNGQHYSAIRHGGNGGQQYTIDIDVDGGERIVGVLGRSGNHVDQLGFFTNQGRIFGPYGRCGGGPFTVNRCHVRGIFGRSGSMIDSIGFHCTTP